jgi:DtxR family Mn-dependent transcriptional regulator
MGGKREVKRGREDYLRIILELAFDKDGKEQGARVVDIATRLGIAKASVSEMVKMLAEKKFVTAKPYSKVFLTAKGKNLASNIAKTYDVTRSFLKKYLKYDNKRACEEAHRLEHAFSAESVNALNDFVLGRRPGAEIPAYIY